MIRLKSLKLKNFRSFEEAEVSFPETGLVRLHGLNTETGGGSAVGKTNLILGVLFALECCPLPATALRRKGCDEFWSEVALTKGDQTLTVRKGSTSFAVVDGQKVQGAAAIKKALSGFIEIDPSVLEAVSYKEQREGSTFLSLSDDEKKEFLSLAVPMMKSFAKVAEEAEEKAKLIHQAVESKSSRLQSLQAVLDGVQDLSPPDLSSYHERIQRLQRDVEEAKALWESERSKLPQKSPEVPFDVKVHATEEERSSLSVIESEIDALEEQRKSSSLKKTEKQRTLAQLSKKISETEALLKAKAPILSRDHQRIEGELGTAKQGRCPTCKQSWVDQAFVNERESQLRAVSEQMSGMVQTLKDTQAQKPLVKALEEEIALLTQEHDSLCARAVELKAKQNEVLRDAYSRYLQMGADLKVEFASKQAKVSELQLTYTSLLERLKADQRALEQATANALNVQRFMAQVAEQRKEAKALQEEVAALNVELALERDVAFAAGPKGFSGAIFDQILTQVATYTNEPLSIVPNMTGIRMKFVTESGAKAQKRISPMVSDGNAEWVKPNVLLSGGQLSALELAVDAAIGKVMEERNQTSCGWLFLDEPFDGLSRVEREAFVDVLQRLAQDKLVVVVDHSFDTSNLFPLSIKIERDSVSSKVVPSGV